MAQPKLIKKNHNFKVRVTASSCSA